MYILEGFRLKGVFTSRIAFSHFSLNVVPNGIQPFLKTLSHCQIFWP